MAQRCCWSSDDGPSLSVPNGREQHPRDIVVVAERPAGGVRRPLGRRGGEFGGYARSVVTVLLETPRLVLRQFTMDDADELVRLNADPEVMRYVPDAIATSREEVETEILPVFLGYYERFSGYGFWAVIEKSTGEFLGWFHLRPGPDAGPGEAELGYRLRQSAWGRGYATEGSHALIRAGFTRFGMRRVTAEAMAANVASRRVMEKAGLKLVRTFHQNWPHPMEGEELGVVEYALDKADWERNEDR